MSTIETVRGPVDLAELGPTLMHEHIVILEPESLQNYARVWGAPYWDEEAGVADAIAKLRRLRESGIRTLVDPTAIGLGRFIPRIQRINAEVDLNVVVATGVYSFLELPRFLAYRTDDALVGLFVRELREGIDDTGVKAAFLKCAVEEWGLAGDIPRILRLIAAAAVETGEAGDGAHERADEDGPARARGAHRPRRRAAADRDRARGRLERPRLPARDRRHGREPRLRPLQHPPLQPGRRPHRDARRAPRGGLRRPQIHLGHDGACFYDFMQHNPPFADERPDYLHLCDAIFPALLERGVTQAQIDELLVANPQRFFA